MSRIVAKPVTAESWLQSWRNRADLRKAAETVEAVTPWFSGDTAPERAGWYDRMFTDGVYRQWWCGSLWFNQPGLLPHWRKKGDYPCWRGLQWDSQGASDATREIRTRATQLRILADLNEKDQAAERASKVPKFDPWYSGGGRKLQDADPKELREHADRLDAEAAALEAAP